MRELVHKRVVLVRDEEVDEVVLEGREAIDRFLDGQSLVPQRRAERFQDLGEEDVLTTGGDEAYAGPGGDRRRLSPASSGSLRRGSGGGLLAGVGG
jgi:hypothetical protein